MAQDVFVNYAELRIDDEPIGEGSFGVVHKAWFRGAQVAVKRMRSPFFAALTAVEIEQFRKEAYMMSRLRHPNIVLVMGISFAEALPAPGSMAPGRMQALLDDDAPSPSAARTVCIITEFLEQVCVILIFYLR